MAKGLVMPHCVAGYHPSGKVGELASSTALSGAFSQYPLMVFLVREGSHKLGSSL